MENMTGLQLIKIDFDSSENVNPIYSKVIYNTVDELSKTAHFKMSNFIKNYKIDNFYLGWNIQIYPQFEIKTIFIN